ncbi:hypothetical protein IFM89_021234 [Coptis chinensis]|uniref:Protein SCAR n=1 Tax=Coptis chinensis TaxID=261450 RepID=A0A835HG46_9MAGN|nr:hypothetical protein IFM89_021234 [Coptis chinensis]
MPLRRYEIRNEYSLADPELIRGADKDDPEALLEGVAMSGLVGVLRQLGDLAQFAAEIFHDLHEEVMATSARGHGLTLRVQQLEAEFPLIEKPFLSQTSHSQFLNNSGVEWHPNLRLDQSVIPQGDLPRFVMDSYEECRGPPRLFLLDKFDIAGAGACLKRYSDPSFFKAEFDSTEAAKEELKREKITHKVKKRGSRWRNGENPEIKASQSKLHQLLLEERCQSENIVHTHNVKLKRRHSNNSLVDSNAKKSYMERFIHSPDSKFAYENSTTPARLKMGSSNISELVPEPEVRRSLSKDLSHNREEKELDPSVDKFDEDVNKEKKGVVREKNLNKLWERTPENELESVPPTFKGEDKKELVVNSKSKAEAGADGYHSDDVNSEIDHYTDALTTMDSEIETDTESRPKKERAFKIEKKYVDSETNEDQKELQNQFSDTHSVGSSIVSEDGNSSMKKGRYGSSYSDTFSNSAENMQSDGDLASKVHPATLAANVHISEKVPAMRNTSVSRSLEHDVPNGSCNEVSAIPSYSPDLTEADCGSDVKSCASVVSRSRGASLSELQFFQPNLIMIHSDAVKELSPKTEIGNASHDLLSTTSVSFITSQSTHDLCSVGSQKSQTVEMLDGGNPDTSGDSLLPPAHEEIIVLNDDKEESLSTCDTDNSCNDIDLPDSVALHTGTELRGFQEQDLEATPGTESAPECGPDCPSDGDVNFVRANGTVVDIEEIMPPGEKSECLASRVNYPETDDVREPKDRKMTNFVQLLELDTAVIGITDSELEASDNNMESNMLDSACSELETLSKSMEIKRSDSELKDRPASDIHLSSSVTERNSDTAHELPWRSTISDKQKAVLAAELHFQEAKSGLMDVHPEDVENSAVYCSPIGSPSKDHAKVLEDYSRSGDVNQNVLELIVASDANASTSTNVKKEPENEPAVASSDMARNYMLEKTSCCLCNHREKTESFDHRYELTDPSNHMYLDGDSIVPSKSSSMDTVCETADLNVFLPTTSYMCEKSESSSFLLKPISQGSGPHPVASSQKLLDSKPNTPDLNISLPDNNALQDNLEETPPLPPLPPMQWRIGKHRHDSPTSEGMSAFPTFNTSSPLSPEVEIAQQGLSTFHGKVAKSLNPFFSKLTSDDPRESFEMLGNDVVQPILNSSSLVESAVECQNVLRDHPNLDPSIAEPLNPFLPVSEEELQHSSSTSGEEMLQRTSLNPFRPASANEVVDTQRTSLNPFRPASTNEIVDTQCVSLSSQEDQGSSFNSLASIQHRDDEKMHHTLLDFERAMMQPQTSSSFQTIENQKHGNDLQTLEGELKWQSNMAAVIPSVEDVKQNGSLKSWLSRPRDPLIEAVASHDKSNLRKVTERVRPQISPQADERNSLLEQIRTKSFSLKPAVGSRPSIQGPKTNLKVVAILEKANAIRQALAGSDEDDDEDSWSDS